MSKRVSKEDRQKLIDAKWPYVDELMDLTDADRAVITNRFDASATSPPKPKSTIDLTNTEFPEYTKFSGFLFPSETSFSDAAFQGTASFSDAAFQGTANFRKAALKGGTLFRNTAFQGDTDFGEATFVGYTYFRSATFKGVANFQGRVMPRYMSNTADGRGFVGKCLFEGATFGNVVMFTNRVFLGETDFNNCRFLKNAPVFDGAELHEGTTWHGIEWPPVPSDSDAARLQVNAYRRLRLEMNKLQDHDQELNFLALELKAKRGAENWSEALLISAYQVSCDFGRSVSLPLLWLFGLWFGCGHAYRTLTAQSLDWFQALGFSAASLGGLFGMRREFFADLAESLPDGLLVLSGVQSVLGAVFVFLLGLTLRNRFRIR